MALMLIIIGFAMMTPRSSVAGDAGAFPEYITDIERKSQMHGRFAEMGVPSEANTMRNVATLGVKITPKRDFILEFPPLRYETEFEVIMAAKLKLFWQPLAGGLKRTKGSFKMTILDLINKAKDKKLPMDSKTVFNRDPELDAGFYEFDILPAVRRWKSLKATAKKGPKSSLLVELSSMRVRLPNNSLVEFKPLGNITGASSLLLFTHDKRHQIRKAKREAKRPRNKRRRKKLKKNFNAVCGVHKHFVNFDDIGWSDWVISPQGYEMNFCSGECPFPMADHMNATNNAIFQQLYHRMDPDAVPAPCCVPTELEPLTLLYKTEDNGSIIGLKEAGTGSSSYQDRSTVMVKVYNDMRVKSCGCR